MHAIQPDLFSENKEAAEEPLPFRQRAIPGCSRVGVLPARSFAVALALLFAWSVVNGRHGLSTWYQQRNQEKQLKHEIGLTATGECPPAQPR